MSKMHRTVFPLGPKFPVVVLDRWLRNDQTLPDVFRHNQPSSKNYPKECSIFNMPIILRKTGTILHESYASTHLLQGTRQQNSTCEFMRAIFSNFKWSRCLIDWSAVSERILVVRVRISSGINASIVVAYSIPSPPLRRSRKLSTCSWKLSWQRCLPGTC